MRKRMHPHQVMDASELTCAVKYAFISAPRPPLACRDEDIRVSARALMMGVFSNTVGWASRRGWDLKARRRSQKGHFLTRLPLDSLLTVSPSLRGAVASGMRFMTLHQDGWNAAVDRADHPTLVYWTEGQVVGHRPVFMGHGWDYASTYFGDLESITSRHYIVVPDNRWFDNPKLLAQGERPEPSGVYAAPAAEFEAETRRRKDEAMRRRHGF